MNDYSSAIRFLYDLRLFGTKLGLEATRTLAERSGRPQDRLRFIHVAGTNGKGSVCAMLESIYRQAGLRVGLFTSPHLVRFGERFQVNRRPMSEAEVVQCAQRMLPRLSAFSRDAHPTFFEVVTVMALDYFDAQACDLVIWETGMGGRLDATNIVTPLASVITNIGRDHQKWLGDNLADIAREKAGIIKPGVPVLTGVAPGVALDVIQEKAESVGAPLTVIDPGAAESFTRPALAGAHQRRNARLAVSAVEQLQPLIPVSDDQICEGLRSVQWPGRFQRVPRSNGGTLILDGAHNEIGLNALRDTLHTEFPNTRFTLIFGLLQDKDWQAMCRLLAPLGDAIGLVPIHSMRAAPPKQLLPVCQAANPNANVKVHENLRDALAAAPSDQVTVITGSMYLIGEALGLLENETDESGMNDWGR